MYVVAFNKYEHGTIRNYVVCKTAASAKNIANTLARDPKVEEILIGNMKQVK